MKCRYCQQEIEAGKEVGTTSYWSSIDDLCHAECKQSGIRQEAIDCQLIDADCNDCKHFQRGEVVKRWLSAMEHGKAVMKLVNMGVINGHCAKLNQPTQAFPNKWTGRECFEHRRI